MRGEAHLGQRKEEATAATNSLVFNAFIWLQVQLFLLGQSYLASCCFYCSETTYSLVLAVHCCGCGSLH